MSCRVDSKYQPTCYPFTMEPSCCNQHVCQLQRTFFLSWRIDSKSKQNFSPVTKELSPKSKPTQLSVTTKPSMHYVALIPSHNQTVFQLSQNILFVMPFQLAISMHISYQKTFFQSCRIDSNLKSTCSSITTEPSFSHVALIPSRNQHVHQLQQNLLFVMSH